MVRLRDGGLGLGGGFEEWGCGAVRARYWASFMALGEGC